MNTGTSARSACTAIGVEEYQSVNIGNMLMERIGLDMNSVFPVLQVKRWGIYDTVYKPTIHRKYHCPFTNQSGLIDACIPTHVF